VDDLRLRLLGPMEIVAGGRALPLPGSAERALLAQLLLSPGRTIPASMLIDRLWAESAVPVDPTNALQVRVSKLRRSLKANRTPDLVTREGVGYRANVDPEAVDAIDFANRIRLARAATAAASGQDVSPEDLEPCDVRACAARGSTSSFVTAKSPSRRSSTSTFTSSRATQETVGRSFPIRRNARGRSLTARVLGRQLLGSKDSRAGLPSLPCGIG
jgi:DNA-binding winged helix-turn-helix (wHTH) protein